MKRNSVRLAAAIAAVIALAGGCSRDTSQSAAAPKETADQFVERLNRELTELGRELARGGLGLRDVHQPGHRVPQRQGQRALARILQQRGRSRRRPTTTQQLSPPTARTLELLKLGVAAPAPKDPAKRAELAGTHFEDGRHVRRREVLPERSGLLQGPDAAHRRPGEQPQLRRADRSVDRLALDRAADAQGLRALRRARERRRARARLRRPRRDVALELRHAAGRVHEGSGAAVGPGQAAVRLAALLRARQAAEDLRRGARAGRQADSRAPARQHVGAAVGRNLSAGRAVSAA